MDITKNVDALTTLGSDMKTKLAEYKADRQTLEQQLLKNLRQYRGKYDPDVLAILDSVTFVTRSKVYPRDTRIKVTGFVAKMMEMMFPATDKNWALKPTPYPNIPAGELTRIIRFLAEQKVAEFQQQQQQGVLVSTPEGVTAKEIEDAVQVFAKDRAGKMELEIEDQLADIGGERIEYPQLCKKVLRSAGIYGFGVLEGPLVRTQTERTFEPNAVGEYKEVKKQKRRPYLECVKVWDLFPDLSAKHWREQDGIFRRRVFIKNGLAELAERNDFMGDVIKKYIKDHPDGNYVPMSYESELDTVNNTQNVGKNKKGKFEVFRFLGYISAAKLMAVDVDVPKKQQYKDVLADLWFIDDAIIKADLAPFGENPADSYPIFVYEDDEECGLTGMGLPEILRDSQMRLCSLDRATMDNMGAVAGPIWEVNKALLGRKHDIGAIHSFRVIERDDDNPLTAGIPAARQVNTDSHITEYIALREKVKEILDFESNLPSWLMGDTRNLGEAFRTSNNMSMMTGGANMITKDVVRSFDRFTSSVIGGLVLWNMELNDKEEIKGDYQVQPQGSLSLVAKEIRGAALDQLWATLTPEERAIVKVRDTLVERFKARDLPTDLIMGEDEARQVLDNMAQAAAAARAKEEALTEAKTSKTSADAQRSGAQAQEILTMLQDKIASARADVEQKLTNAKGVKDRGDLEHLKLLLDNLEGAGSRAGSSAAGAA